MKSRGIYLAALASLAIAARADSIGIGTAAQFAVLGEAGVTNTGPTIIDGSLAGSTGTPAVTGFTFSTSPGPGIVVPPGVGYTTGVANSGLGTPFGDALIAYDDADALSGFNEGTATLGAGGLTTLAPGVYSFTSATVLLNGLLLLDAGGSNTASWIFQIPFALTTASSSIVEIVDAGAGSNFNGSITWAVGSAATLGTNSEFLGTVISQAGGVVQAGASVGCGRVISLDASVTLNDNTISLPSACMVDSVGSPEPGTVFTLLIGTLVLASIKTFSRRARGRIAPAKCDSLE